MRKKSENGKMVSVVMLRGHCSFFKLEIVDLALDVNMSVENCPRASVLNELMLFSEFSTVRLESSGSVFSEEISVSQVTPKTFKLK